MALITGTQSADWLNDTSLDDQIYLLGGNDEVDLTTGNDYVDAGAGDDQVHVFGTGLGNKQVFLGLGDDSADLHQLDGRASVWGGDGADRIIGGHGNDSLYGDNGDDYLWGYTGNDLLIGGLGEDLLNGSLGNDTLHGANDNDVLWGGDGDDQLRGGRGVDELLGDDRGRYAQPGADRFIFDDSETGVGAGNRDIILDFTHSEGDRIDVSLIDANVYTTGDQAFVWRAFPLFNAPGQLNAIYDAARGRTVVSGNVDNDSAAEFEIQLEGAQVAQNDFIL